MEILLPGSEITKNTQKKLCIKSRFAQIFPATLLTAATNCCQLWLLVQAVASFVSTWRLIPKSTDQLYAIPIDCIASFLLSDFLQDCDTVAKYQWWPPPWIITLAPDLDKFRIAIKIRYCDETISMFNSANTVKWDNSGDKAELLAVYELILWDW